MKLTKVKYKGRVIGVVGAQHVGKPFSKAWPRFLGWGCVMPADAGKFVILDNGLPYLESACQRDSRLSAQLAEIS